MRVRQYRINLKMEKASIAWAAFPSKEVATHWRKIVFSLSIGDLVVVSRGGLQVKHRNKVYSFQFEGGASESESITGVHRETPHCYRLELNNHVQAKLYRVMRTKHIDGIQDKLLNSNYTVILWMISLWSSRDATQLVMPGNQFVDIILCWPVTFAKTFKYMAQMSSCSIGFMEKASVVMVLLVLATIARSQHADLVVSLR